DEQVALVLAIVIVGDDDDLAAGEGGDGGGHVLVVIVHASLPTSLRAKRSNPGRSAPTLDCFVASLLAMTIYLHWLGPNIPTGLITLAAPPAKPALHRLGRAGAD